MGARNWAWQSGADRHLVATCVLGHFRYFFEFIARLRELCGAKPVGFNICIGRQAEFVELCEVMRAMNIDP